MSVVDYTKEMVSSGAFGCHGLIAAHGMDRNVLLLRKLDEPRRRSDGKLGKYELEYRWLSQECSAEADESYVCVIGSDYILLTAKECPSLTNGGSLFDHFNLF